jgi:calcineurin-like phosphoesterase family protein
MKTIKIDSREVNMFFTSDLHLSHNGIVPHRPNFSSVEDMNESLILNWNKRVASDDIVFVLGDFCFHGKQIWNKFISRLNGFIWLIEGNHDKGIPKDIKDKFQSTPGFLNLRIQDDDFKQKEQRVTLCHYPMMSWYQSHAGSWQLFGHIHSSPTSVSIDYIRLRDRFYNQMDVGVDAHNFTPLHWEEVKQIMNKKINKL